jgi:SAM-dependent methyltransferase
MLASCASFSVREQASSVTLPYEDGSMDFVTSVCVYHHVHGRDRTLLTREIRRVLAPGGLYCIVEHNPWNPVTRTIVERCAVDVDAELLAARSASRLLQVAGFETLRLSYFLYLPERLFDQFAATERVLEHLPLGGQYALLARAPA